MNNNDGKCSVCGKQLTDYGNKELLDGILCRDCVKLASPWLSDDDFKKRSVEDIKKHLKYREDNLERLKNFKDVRSVKGKYSLYIDDDNKMFVVSKRKDYVKDNADVIDFDDIEEISVYEKQYKNEDGVDVFFEAKLNNKEIPVLKFRVNEFTGFDKQSDEYKKASELAVEYLDELVKDLDFEEES